MAGAVQSSPPCFEPPTREAALSIIALAATLLFAHGQTTERTVVTAERLGRALGVPVRVLPDWGELIVEIEGTSLSQIVPTKPLGVDMNRVVAITTVVDRLCEGTLCGEEARPALLLAGDLLPVSTLRFTSFAAIGATSLGIIFGALDTKSLMLIAASAALGALVRRWPSGFGSNPFIQPLCAALIAGLVAAVAATSSYRPIVGRPPIIPGQVPLPPWAHELDGSRKVVLVTQGTLANHNFGLLIAPTLAALANEPDLLVVATAGGRPVDAIPGPIPANARLAQYLPFEWILPKADVFVTNGGYGSVNQAMSFGLPLVTAGLTEDKADVNARVAWSGVGIDLATNEPTPQALREAVRTVLDRSAYRRRASSMADEFNEIDTRAEILRIIGDLAHAPKEAVARQGATTEFARRRRVGSR